MEFIDEEAGGRQYQKPQRAPPTVMLSAQAMISTVMMPLLYLQVIIWYCKDIWCSSSGYIIFVAIKAIIFT